MLDSTAHVAYVARHEQACFEKRRSLSSVEAAAVLGVGRDTVVRAADRGEIPMTRTPGGQRRFDPADVEAYRARLSLPAPQAAPALAASSKEVA